MIITLKKKIQLILFFILFVGGLIFCNYVERTYTKATVIAIEDDIITVKDFQGFVWEFTGNNFYVGEQIELVIDNNLTDDTIIDDKIKNIKK